MTDRKCEDPYREPGYSYFESLHRVYWNLFRPPAAGEEDALPVLAKALAAFTPEDPTTKKMVEDTIKRLCCGEQPFTLHQLTVLQDVMDRSRPMAPIALAKATEPQKKDAERARAFWKAAIGGNVSDFEKFSDLLHEYREDRSAANRAALDAQIHLMQPGLVLNDAQIERLVDIAVQQTRFNALAWWDAFHDAW